MNRPVLIVGGGPSGLSAAHALAAAGQRVVLVDKADRLGGAPILSGYAKLVPSGEWAKDAIGGMVKRIESNKLVDVRKNATVKTFVGGPGDFHATLSDGTQVEAGAAILCTGFTHFDSINKPEWGFGTYPDVVTTTQVEQMFSSGKGVRCPSDGREPDRVAILLCVGSRDRQIGREWCSKICCTVSSNLAMEIREALPKCSVYIYYMDIRTFGLYEGPLLLGEPGEIQGQVHQGTHRRSDVRRQAADRQGRRHAGEASDHHSRSTWWCTPSAWTPTSTT